MRKEGIWNEVQGDHSACAKPPVPMPFWPGLGWPGQAKAFALKSTGGFAQAEWSPVHLLKSKASTKPRSASRWNTLYLAFISRFEMIFWALGSFTVVIDSRPLPILPGLQNSRPPGDAPGSPGCIVNSVTSLLHGGQGCQMAKFDPFLSLDWAARVEGVGAQSKQRKGSNFAA